MPFFKLPPSTDSPLLAHSALSALSNVPRPVPAELWIEARDEQALRLLDRIPEYGLAVVGTRHPHPRSLYLTRKLIEGLQGSGLIILSGLARGIDQAAHEAALVFGLPTLAVLGCGLGHHYPPGSSRLRDRIIENRGLVISEFEPDAEPRPYRFVQRNRLIAGWSKATCVMQAGTRSGALLTADYALQLHRTVLAVPHPPGEHGFEGNQRLLDDHAVHALWGPHSLGSVGESHWLELSSAGRFTGQKFPLLEKTLQLPLDGAYGQESPRHCRIPVQGENDPEIPGSRVHRQSERGTHQGSAQEQTGRGPEEGL